MRRSNRLARLAWRSSITAATTEPRTLFRRSTPDYGRAMSNTEYAAGKDFTNNGSNFTGKGEALSEFRGLQADLNLYAQTANFEAVRIDGIVGARTADAVKKVVEAVLAKN